MHFGGHNSRFQLQTVKLNHKFLFRSQNGTIATQYYIQINTDFKGSHNKREGLKGMRSGCMTGHTWSYKEKRIKGLAKKTCTQTNALRV